MLREESLHSSEIIEKSRVEEDGDNSESDFDYSLQRDNMMRLQIQENQKFGMMRKQSVEQPYSNEGSFKIV